MATPATPTTANASSVQASSGPTSTAPSTTTSNAANANANAANSAFSASAAAALGAPGGGGADVEYSLHERVLCYHGPLIYEAKVLRVQNMKEPSALTGYTGMHYYVHYKGWKHTWDEWVQASRLLKHTDTNIQHQKTLQAQHAAASHNASGAGGGHGTNASTAGGGGPKGTKGGGGGALGGHGPPGTSTASASGGSGGGGGGGAGSGSATGRLGVRKDARGTKRGRDDDESAKKPDMKLVIPEILKAKLVDDWEAVTKNNQIVRLPREPTVEDILREFSEWVGRNKPGTLKEPNLMLPTIISGIQCYFDKALGSNLLYRFERLQYSDIRKRYWTGQDVVVGVTEKEMSCIYGAEHLLRMLVTLPQMIAQTSLDPESVAHIRDYVNELLQYMVRERDRLFLKEYDNAPPAYQNVVRS